MNLLGSINLPTPLVSGDVSKARNIICNKCPSYNRKFKTCNECGCFMPAKTKLAGVKCPSGKW